MNAYHHGLQSDHRFQAAKSTGQKVGDAFYISGGPGLGALFAKIAAGGLILGFAGYFVWCAIRIWGL
ncbi:hypothetical protein [Phenylobacterium sp.]|uniref:hypothetical protein n=1 Tax=Phenylobacterium sp. TaxID=1871053 RepID=UPI00261BD3DD|nr:hypothetical protein [Phenylobacterium sp.]